MSQEEDDKLDALWRRASAKDAGRPAAKTRAAILAEAAAAARRREPAANAPRYWMRMVAGVAVVGIGLVLWRQTDVRLPGEMTVAEPMRQEVARGAGGAGAAAPVADAAAPGAEAELQQDQSVSPEEAAAPAPAMRSSAPTPVPVQEAPAPPREQVDEGDRQAMKVAQERALPAATADRRAAPQGDFAALAAVPPSAAPAPDGASLLREHFPTQDASTQTHRLWVVLDAAGKVLLTGELEQGARLDDLAPRIRRETGRDPTAWRIESLVNQQERSIEMGIMQLAR